jgi:hypothetical protein
MRIRMAEYVDSPVTINVCLIMFGEAKGRECLENIGMKERIIFKLILKIYDQGHGIFTRGRRRTKIFFCEKVLECLSSIKCKKCTDLLTIQ